MKRVHIFLSLLFLVYLPSWAQTTGKSAFFLEIMSAGISHSINFETGIKTDRSFTYLFRAGISITKDILAIPIGIHAYTTPGDHHFEWSIVAMPHIKHYKTIFRQDGVTDTYLYLVPGLGYRYQPQRSRWFARAAIHPMIEMDPPSTNIFDVDPKLVWGLSAAVGLRLK